MCFGLVTPSRVFLQTVLVAKLLWERRSVSSQAGRGHARSFCISLLANEPTPHELLPPRCLTARQNTPCVSVLVSLRLFFPRQRLSEKSFFFLHLLLQLRGLVTDGVRGNRQDSSITAGPRGAPEIRSAANCRHLSSRHGGAI